MLSDYSPMWEVAARIITKTSGRTSIFHKQANNAQFPVLIDIPVKP